jgi:hypothetical protein
MGDFGKYRDPFFPGKGFHFFRVPGVDIKTVDDNTALDFKMVG